MSTRTPSLAQNAARGAAAGVAASLVMAMYAMVAAYTKDAGFFTPLYHIGSLLNGDADMARSMMADQQDSDAFTFLVGPAVLGAMIHMMTGAMFGAMFGAAVGRLRLGPGALSAAGAAYGGAVFAVSAFLALPLAAELFESGDPIANMAEMAGWGVFVVEHLLFGLTLGALYTARDRRSASVPVSV